MEPQFFIQIGMVLSRVERQRRDIDGDVKNAEESQSKHGRDHLNDGSPVNQLKLCSQVVSHSN